jgi:predicted short-subunit dehydrogenase-like oxidoreductase (DUF2520 family)
MKKPPPVALICAGKLTDTPLTRLRGLVERLGPVGSSSLRVASRVVNTLRAGYPVSDYSAFQDCGVVFLSVPDDAVPGFVGDLAAAGLDWSRKYVVLFSTLLESDTLAPLAALGAHTVSLCAMDGFDGRLFLAEGDRPGVAVVRPLLPARDVKLMHVPREHKVFYLAAAACTGPLLASVLICAGECLKLMGLAASEVSDIMLVQVGKTTRGFLHSGKKMYHEPPDLERQVAALRERKLEIAHFFEQSAMLGRGMAGEGVRESGKKLQK